MIQPRCGLISHERGGRGAFFISRSFARRENQRADRGDETFAALHSTTTRNAEATQDNPYTTPIQPVLALRAAIPLAEGEPEGAATRGVGATFPKQPKANL